MLSKQGAYISHTLEAASITQVFEKILQDWQDHRLPTKVMTTITPKDAVETILKRIVP
jgi:hypothetical protein